MPLEKLGRWLGDAFSGRNRSLRDVNGPSQVLVEGEIASPNVIESPVTPVRAAIMTVGVLREHVARNEYTITGSGYGYGPLDTDFYILVGSIQLNGPFVVKTAEGTIHVPQTHVEVVYQSSLETNPTSLSRMPEMLADLVAQADGTQALFYNEQFLGQGDRISLRATVRPMLPTAGVAADFEVDVDAERPLVVEL